MAFINFQVLRSAELLTTQMVSMAATSALSFSFSFTKPLQLNMGGTLGASLTNPAVSRSFLLILAQKKVKKIRKIFLTEDVANLGKRGEQVEVRAGFFRNFLLPTGKARIMTPSLLDELKIEEERAEADKIRVKEEAEQLASALQTAGSFSLGRKCKKGNRIIGKVTERDLVSIIKTQINKKIDKRLISIPDIRETGEYIAELKLHPEVTMRLKLNVWAR